MRYLNLLLLTGFVAGTASASAIPVSDLNMVITGTNLQYAQAGGSVDTERGPVVGATLYAGHGPVAVTITLTSYLTVDGATGTGTLGFLSNYQSCDGTPFSVVAGCGAQAYSGTIAFTFGTPIPIWEQYRISIMD